MVSTGSTTEGLAWRGLAELDHRGLWRGLDKPDHRGAGVVSSGSTTEGCSVVSTSSTTEAHASTPYNAVMFCSASPALVIPGSCPEPVEGSVGVAAGQWFGHRADPASSVVALAWV